MVYIITEMGLTVECTEGIMFNESSLNTVIPMVYYCNNYPESESFSYINACSELHLNHAFDQDKTGVRAHVLEIPLFM